MYLPGVGPKKAQILEKELEILTISDLIHYFPYRYIDRSKFYKIREIETATAYVQVRGVIKGFRQMGEGRTKRLVAMFTDGNDFIELVFFKGLNYILDAYLLDTEYIIFGKPSLFNGKFSFVHPEIEKPSPDRMTGFMPLYHTSEKMKNHFLNSKAVQKLVLTALKNIDRKEINETLPQHIIDKYHFPNASEALVTAHFPKDMPSLDKALARLKFEELFYIQLAILRQANQFRSKAMGHPFNTIGHYFNTFYKECLPFDLTDAQKRVLREIRADVRGPGQMNRLLQGDVGSGKTIVALLSMLMAIDNGYQACIVAPTEILATQHYESMSRMLEPLGLEVRLLTGSTRKKEREHIADGLTSGDLKILVGTHAVFEDKVQFAKLGIVIIDEQHRFGVAQRAKLWGKNIRPPHVLVMTATPIPRTLAMTLYGDLDVSVIDQLPPGRKAIQTEHIFDEKRPQLNNFLRRQMAQGRQVYVVYPLIKESEKTDMKDLENGFEAMKKVFSEFTVCMVHGKMKPAEKEVQMQEFISGRANMLVSTTVIEVGVNVPNATVMVIENAERFGLSQLHQLRGRVGRGGDQSYCLLITKYQISSDTRKRIDIMTQTTNGFEIAEADLRLRGPGDLEGTLQSGLPFNLRVADLSRDGALLTMARDEAEKILSLDPMLSQPENALLLNQLHSKTRNVVNWSFIS